MPDDISPIFYVCPKCFYTWKNAFRLSGYGTPLSVEQDGTIGYLPVYESLAAYNAAHSHAVPLLFNAAPESKDTPDVCSG